MSKSAMQTIKVTGWYVVRFGGKSTVCHLDRGSRLIPGEEILSGVFSNKLDAQAEVRS